MEPIFIFIILMFLGGMGAWYFYGTRTPKESSITLRGEIPHEHIYDRKPESKETISETLDKLNNKQVQISRQRFGDKNTYKLLTHRDFELRRRCEKKIYDLQEQLARHGKDGFELAPKDLIRYNAMIEVLKAMIN